MNLVNPEGREQINLEGVESSNDIIPKGCICSSGQYSVSTEYKCAQCGCQCDQENSVLNVDYNLQIAQNDRNYVNGSE